MSTDETVHLRIARFDPGDDEETYYEDFDVPVIRDMRILDALDYVYSQLSHEFAFRWYCGTKRCGQCAVMVNGRPQLACWEPVQEEMTVEPLRHFPVIRDLVVDFSENEEQLTALRPVLERDEPYAGFPEETTHADMRQHYRLMDCIDCRICVAACSVVGAEGSEEFAGPYALVQLAKIATHAQNGVDLTDQIVAAHPEFCGECNDCVSSCPNQIPILSGAINVLRHIDGVPAPVQTDATLPEGCGTLTDG
jgi:succinate dehydrogenase/fumarate reductase iron-sulfur protein